MSRKITLTSGDLFWVTDGSVIHRTDGPAILRNSGTKEWYIHGKRHRVDGPAVEFIDGHREWYYQDQLHRIDGPAVELTTGQNKCWTEWWYRGEKFDDRDSYIEFLLERRIILQPDAVLIKMKFTV